VAAVEALPSVDPSEAVDDGGGAAPGVVEEVVSWPPGDELELAGAAALAVSAPWGFTGGRAGVRRRPVRLVRRAGDGVPRRTCRITV